MKSALIIDRDAETRLIARRVLARAGFAVSAAADDRSAAGPFDLVIADLAGVSLAGLHQRHPEARVLTMSSQGRVGLAKPFTPSQLLAAVRLCLARR